MAQVHGAQTRGYLDGYSVAPMFRGMSIEGKADIADSSVFADTAHNVITGQQDADWSGEAILATDFLDGATNTIHNVLQGRLAGSSLAATVLPAGDVLGAPAYSVFGPLIEYDFGDPIGDVVVLSAKAQSRIGLDAGVVLAPGTTLVTTSVGTAAVDNAAPSTNGGSAVLHCISAAGTTPTLAGKVQHSTDTTTWLDLATFTGLTAASARSSQRVAVAPGTTVNRYLRFLPTVGGTSPSFGVLVQFSRNPAP